MAESYRLAVLKRLTALLQQITPANGFDYDLSAAAFRGRTIFGDSDPLPCVSILEQTRPDIGVYAGVNDDTRKERWPLVVQGWVTNDTANPTDPAYGLMAAVQLQLGKINATDKQGDPAYPEHYMLGPGDGDRNKMIVNIGFGPGVVSPPREQVSSQAFFWMPLWIELAERTGQPYIAV